MKEHEAQPAQADAPRESNGERCVMKICVFNLWKSVLAVGLLMVLPDYLGGASPEGSPSLGDSPLPESGPFLAMVEENLSPPMTNTEESILEEDSTPPAPGAEAADAEGSEEPVMALPGEMPSPPKVSPGVEEVVQLARAQVGDDVLLAYVENSPMRFNMGGSEILYLHDLGLSAQLIAAMIRHDRDLPAPAWNAANTEQPGPPADNAEPPPAEPSEDGAEPSTAAAVSTAPVTEGPAVVNQDYFYNSLAPYGTWMDVPGYGWCWRPTVAVLDGNWQPYAQGGRWMYTDYGWYWHSYYSWGWAPFHYGRWHLSGPHGWVWVPDTCWGPAWVTWRHCDGYYGWAPLPPGAVYRSGFGMTYYGSRVGFSFGFGFSSACYTFVPVHSFYSSRLWSHCVPRSRVGPIYRNSTVINNYGNGNHTVINVGPGRDTIAAATRSEIPKVRVREASSRDVRLVRAESLSRDGNSLHVYRPHLPEQSAQPPKDITRHQQELQSRTQQLASSEAAHAAVIRARTPESARSVNRVQGTRLGSGPSAAPQRAGSNVQGARSASESLRQPSANPRGIAEQRTVLPSNQVSPRTRGEPQRSPRAIEPSRSPVQPRSTIPTPSNRMEAPRQPALQPGTPSPGWSSPTPRIEPVRPPQVDLSPGRSVNPAYSVTPRPSMQLTPRPSSPAPSLVPSASRYEYRNTPSRSFSTPAPARSQAPMAVPSRPSGQSTARPAPSPARSPSAPRSGGRRNR